MAQAGLINSRTYATICLIMLLLLFTHNVFALTICEGKQVLGAIEKVKLSDNNLTLDAKIDTGAATSSLSAINIVTFKRDSKLWVRFTLYLPKSRQKIIFTEPLISYGRIRTRKEENTHQAQVVRPVISLLICIGKQKNTILVNLTDRTDFNYPMLIGITALQKFNALVDVSQKYSVVPMC